MDCSWLRSPESTEGSLCGAVGPATARLLASREETTPGPRVHRDPRTLGERQPCSPGVRRGGAAWYRPREHDGMDRVYRTGRRAEQVLVMLRSLATVSDGGEISELDHALQVATRAERAGADEEVVVGALLHDIGKVFGDAGHGQIAAAVLQPLVRADVVAVVSHHAAFTARHWRAIAPGETDPRDRFADEPWYDLACRFADEWDMRSFDPNYDSQQLEHFTPLIEKWIREP
jgi:predicted HD phosphohydrolase